MTLPTKQPARKGTRDGDEDQPLRVHDGRLDPLETLPLPEGSEVTVSVDMPETVAASAIKPEDFAVWDLGARQITREDAYDDHV